MKKISNFRFSDGAREILEILAADWKMTRKDVLERLLADADPRGGRHVVPDPALNPRQREEVKERTKKMDKEIDEVVGLIKESMKTGRGSVIRQQAVPKPSWKK